jgi:hypothetical protein
LAGRPRRLRWRLANEVAPDYVTALAVGRSALETGLHLGRYPAVRNTRSGFTLAVVPTRAWMDHGWAEHLLGLDLWLTFNLDLPPLGDETVEVALTVTAPEAEAPAGQP